jgi:RNA polymerase sigma-70 factor (ECF subfamily)
MTTQEVAIYAAPVMGTAVTREHRRSATIASDEALIGRISAGDKLAMQILFARHHLRVYRFALRFVRNQALAEDIVSGTFLDVWRRAGRFKSQSAVSTWLLAIARFKALSELRRRPEEQLCDEGAVRAEEPSDNPEMAIQKKDQCEILRKCVTTLLSRNHREIVDLIYYHEKSIEEVAAIVGIHVSSVKTRAFYARKRLSKLLTDRGVDGD